LFARGGGVKSNNNDVRVKALIKNLDNTPYSIGLAILRERLLTYTENDLRAIEKNPDSFNNPIISRGMYKDYFNRVIEELKFDYEDGGSVDDGDFARGGGSLDKMDKFISELAKKNTKEFSVNEYHDFRNKKYAIGVSRHYFKDNDGSFSKFDTKLGDALNIDFETQGDSNKYAKGGGVGNPSKKQMLDYLNMYFDNYSELRTIAIEEDNILTRRMLNSLDNEELQMAYDDAKYEMRAETQFARGGGVRIGSDGREYPFGSAWALEHNKKNKSEKYEIPISSRKS
jgi:hypothetical protein